MPFLLYTPVLSPSQNSLLPYPLYKVPGSRNSVFCSLLSAIHSSPVCDKMNVCCANIFFYFSLCLFVEVDAHALWCMYKSQRTTFTTACGFLESNSGHRAWWQAPLPTDPWLQPLINILFHIKHVAQLLRSIFVVFDQPHDQSRELTRD